MDAMWNLMWKLFQVIYAICVNVSSYSSSSLCCHFSVFQSSNKLPENSFVCASVCVCVTFDSSRGSYIR